MDKTATFYVYQNGIVLGEFTIAALQTGLGHGTFSRNDWIWGAAFKEWRPLGKLISILSAEPQFMGCKGDTRVLPDLQLRPAIKMTNKSVLSRSMRLKSGIR
jgi:hypothetical protein